MKNPRNSAEFYEELVEEMTKDRPDQKKIRQLMLKQGLPYSVDPIIQMNTVLEQINIFRQTRPPQKEDSSLT